jgi:hypothetical protein
MQKLSGSRKKKPETGQEVKKGAVKQAPAK